MAEAPETPALRAIIARLSDAYNHADAAMRRIAESNVHDMNTLHPDGCRQLARDWLAKHGVGEPEEGRTMTLLCPICAVERTILPACAREDCPVLGD